MGRPLNELNLKLEGLEHVQKLVILAIKNLSIPFTSWLKPTRNVRGMFVNSLFKDINLVFCLKTFNRSEAAIENGLDVILLDKSIFHLAVHFCVITLKEPDKKIHEALGAKLGLENGGGTESWN